MAMKRQHSQRGMTLLETLGALALASALMAGLSTLVAAALGDSKAQQAAQHQAQVASAAGKYLAANHTALLGVTAGGAVTAITVAQMKAGGFLPDGFAATNAFDQTPCMLVRQTASGQLDALVATYGGAPAPRAGLQRHLREAGPGGGYISADAPRATPGASALI
jgi:type II secretory pathway pseudopilin PulG